MITESNNILIIPSKELIELQLLELVGRAGMVIECLNDQARKSKGFMIRLTTQYLDEYVWFIPEKSVCQE